MANPDLGTKRVCPETGRKFYDLNKDPIVSPFTGKEYPLSFFETVKSSGRVSAKSREVEDENEVDEEAEDENTVSLSEVEDDEGKEGKDDLPDVDGEDDDVELEDNDSDDGDTFLEEDEDEDDDMTDIIGGGRDDEDDV